jgi:hypothetical protein
LQREVAGAGAADAASSDAFGFPQRVKPVDSGFITASSPIT